IAHFRAALVDVVVPDVRLNGAGLVAQHQAQKISAFAAPELAFPDDELAVHLSVVGQRQNLGDGHALVSLHGRTSIQALPYPIVSRKPWQADPALPSESSLSGHEAGLGLFSRCPGDDPVHQTRDTSRAIPAH